MTTTAPKKPAPKRLYLVTHEGATFLINAVSPSQARDTIAKTFISAEVASAQVVADFFESGRKKSDIIEAGEAVAA